MPGSHQSTLLNSSRCSESVTDKGSQWSDSGPIKRMKDLKKPLSSTGVALARAARARKRQRKSFDIFQDRRTRIHNLAALFEAFYSWRKMLTCVLCAFVNSWHRCTENAPRFTIVSSFQEEASRFSLNTGTNTKCKHIHSMGSGLSEPLFKDGFASIKSHQLFWMNMILVDNCQSFLSYCRQNDKPNLYEKC